MTVDESINETEHLLETIEHGKSIDEMAIAYQKLLMTFRQNPEFEWSSLNSLAPRLAACFKRELARMISSEDEACGYNSTEDLTFPSMRCLGYFLYDPNLVKLLPDSDCLEILQMTCAVISADKSTVSQNHLSLALWCLSTQRLPVKLIVSSMSTVVNSLQSALNYPADNVQAESLGCLLNICRQAPTAAILYNSLWLTPVILNCAHPMLNIRDKAEHILAFMVPLFAENHDRTDSAVTGFFKNHAEAFGKSLEALECKARFLIRVWAHLAVIFSKWLAHSDFMGCFLRLIERCFNDPNSDIRKFTYQAWGRLVYNFSVFGLHERRVTLLMTPILSCLEKEKTKSVRTACVKVWTKLFCGISRRYQEFANVAIFPVLKLLAEDPQEDMKLVGVHMLSCLINGTEHKGAISNIRLLADDLSINDATIKVDARWCRANMNRFLPAICAFARKSPANAGIQMELKCLKTRLLEIITDLNCEELKHTPDSIAATHHALHHLQKLFSESLTEFDWQYAMSFARFIFEKVSGRILICAAYEIKFDEKTLLPWEFVFASAFDAMNIPSGSININLIDEFLQVVLKEDPVGYSSNQEIHRYIDGDLMDLLYRIGLKTATAVAFWSRMVASYAAINSNQSPLKIAELFFGRPLVLWIRSSDAAEKLECWKKTCLEYAVACCNKMDIQNFYARILNYNAENANFDEKLYFKPLVAGLILDISESRLLVLEEFIKKMSHAVYSGFPQEGEEDAIERWMRVVELTFQVIQESVKKMTKDQQLNRELIDSLLNLGEKSLSSWIEDNQKHYSQLEIADINKILNSIDSVWKAILDSTLSAIKSKDFELVQPVYEFGLKSRRKKIAYITANFWSDHWRDVVSNSTLPQKLRNLLKSQTSIEKTQKNSVTNPPLSTIQNDETGGNIKSNESLEVTPQKPVAVKSIENDVNLSNENVSSEDLFKTPKTFELKRKSGPLYSPSFVTPPSILKSRGRPQSKELRRTHAPKIRRVSFMFNADEDNDENENIREEDNKVEKCTAVLPVLPNDGNEIIGSSVDASPAQMMLNHTEGLMQNRSHLCAMSLRQLLDLQRKLHVIMQETTESMARFSQ